MSIPTKPEGATRVQVVSDIHLNLNNAEAIFRTPAILTRLQNGLDDLAPDKVHMIGDNINDELDYSSDLVTAVGNCTAAGAEVYALMGNHDYEVAEGEAASQAAFLAAMTGTPTTSLNHHYEIGDFCFVFFSITDYLPWATDATLPADEVAEGQRLAGHTEADFLWLEATLATYHLTHHVILQTHMPPQRFDYLGKYIDFAHAQGVTNWCLYKQASRDRLHTIAQTYNIALWIFGHVHATHHLDEFAADFPADPYAGQYVNFFRGTDTYGGEDDWGSGWFCSDSSVQYSGIIPVNGESIFFDVESGSNTLTVYSYDHTLRDAFKTTILPLLAKASVLTFGRGASGAPPRLSLMVGSDALGWADLSGAVIGERTKGMPGGDGSLSLTLPPDVAAKARNQLQNGARVKLRANGAPDFGGRICNDPLGGVLASVKDAIAVECSGLWAWADRYGAFAWVWNDSDTAQWTNTQQASDGGALQPQSEAPPTCFSSDTEGRLFILADKSPVFASDHYRAYHLDYWLLGGLEVGCEIVGLDVTYRCNLPVRIADSAPGPWKVWFSCTNNPWDLTYWPLNGTGEATSRLDSYSQSFDLGPDYPNRCLSVGLWCAPDLALPTDDVVSDPWVWVESVVVRCRKDGATVDRTVYLSDALCDMATKPGLASVTAGDVISLGEGNNQIAVRSMTGIRGGMTDLANLYSGELEYWFDLDEDGADRFNHYEKPAAVNEVRNSCWSYGEAAGESTAGLDHDPEACPDWIRMTYLSDGIASIPDGTPRDVWYPATPPTDYSASVQVITEFAGQMFTDAHAASVAQRVHERIAASTWSGSVPIPPTVTDTHGRERGGWQVRPGDRLTVPGLDGAGDLYVTEASWNWASMTGTATVGYPWAITGGTQEPSTLAARLLEANTAAYFRAHRTLEQNTEAYFAARQGTVYETIEE